MGKMGVLSDVQKGQITEACLAGSSVTLIAQLFGVLRATVFIDYMHKACQDFIREEK